MRRINWELLLFVVLAALAINTASTTAAMAEEAPYISVGGHGTRLKAGETRAATTSKVSETFQLNAGAVTITCKEESTKGSVIIGSNPGEPGTGEATIEFTNCTVTGNGSPCSIKEPIVTTPLKSTLAEDSAKKSSISVTEPKTGTIFVGLTFQGTCNTQSVIVEGKVASQNLNSKSELIELGKATPEESIGFANFPSTRITSAWIVKSGVGALASTKLSCFGVTCTIVGKGSGKLAGGELASVLF